jgi:transcription elongation factor Elf1
MQEPFPPPGYILTESAVAGITLYKPAPDQDPHQQVVNFRCPHCDGVTAYNTDNGGLTCGYCGYHEAPAVEQVGRQAEAFEFTVEAWERSSHGWGQARKELECQSCSTHTTLSIEMLTHTCPFCGSNKVVQLKAPQDVLRPRFLIPFATTTDQCRQQVSQWLGSSWMVPKGLQRLGHSAEFVPIYIPFWTFDARTTADWRAEVAHTQRYTVRVNGRTQTRTRTVWRWESGKVSHFFDDLLLPGSSQLSPILLGQIDRYDLNKLVVYDPSFLAGLQAQAYDLPLDAAWERARRQMRAKTKQACKGQASSNRIRNFSMNLDFSQESWRHILLPLYLAVYHYNQEPYQIMVNGQTGQIAGQRPVDWRKVRLAIAALLLPGLLAALIALLLSWLQPGSDLSLLIVAAFALFISGSIAAGLIFNSAGKMDKI